MQVAINNNILDIGLGAVLSQTQLKNFVNQSMVSPISPIANNPYPGAIVLNEVPTAKPLLVIDKPKVLVAQPTQNASAVMPVSKAQPTQNASAVMPISKVQPTQNASAVMPVVVIEQAKVVPNTELTKVKAEQPVNINPLKDLLISPPAPHVLEPKTQTEVITKLVPDVPSVVAKSKMSNGLKYGLVGASLILGFLVFTSVKTDKSKNRTGLGCASETEKETKPATLSGVKNSRKKGTKKRISVTV